MQSFFLKIDPDCYTLIFSYNQGVRYRTFSGVMF